ncbi:hypothetical protein [Streptomyces syringium]|uniref:hypothetical protein n=1 Tax=Streptomyces syringium TaxID=76729 RepID=UPI003454BB87
MFILTALKCKGWPGGENRLKPFPSATGSPVQSGDGKKAHSALLGVESTHSAPS